MIAARGPSGKRRRAAFRLAAGAAAASGTASAAVTAPARSCCRILTESAAVGWGNNFVGQLGDGINLQVQSPNWTAVSGLTSGVVQVSAGNEFAVALTSDGGDFSMVLGSDGSVWDWGDNFFGQLGDGTYAFDPANPSPVQVTGLGSVTQISAGANFSLAIHQVPSSNCRASA